MIPTQMSSPASSPQMPYSSIQPSLKDTMCLPRAEHLQAEPWIQQILSTDYVQSAVLGPGDTDRKDPCPQETDIPAGQSYNIGPTMKKSMIRCISR